MQKLVSVIRAQHQAWSERLSARASLLQSTISQMKDSAVPTVTFPTSPSQQSEVGGTQHTYPTPLSSIHEHEHVQEERARNTQPSSSPLQLSHLSRGQVSQQHSHPTTSSSTCARIEDEGGALQQHLTRLLSHDQIEGGVQHYYPPPPTLSNEDGGRVVDDPLFRDQSGEGVKEDGPVVIPKTSASHQDSLSIFTLSTRYMYTWPHPKAHSNFLVLLAQHVRGPGR